MPHENEDATIGDTGIATDVEAVQERAYRLWEEAGRPHDRSPEDFWLQAERDLGVVDRTSIDR